MPFDLVAEVRCFFGRVRRQLERELQDAVDAVAGEHALLRDELALGALEHAAADRRVFALGVLAHHVEVDIGLGAVGQRRAHAGHQLARPQVHVLVEAAADRDQQAPQRDVVRHVRPAHRAEQDRVRLRQPLHAVRRHHRAGLLVGLARPVVVRELQAEAEAARGGVQHLQRLRHRLLADAVAGHDRDPVGLRHGLSPRPVVSYQRSVIRARGRRHGQAAAGDANATTDWDRDAALTTARILLEIEAINFRPGGAVHLHLGLEVAGLYRLPPHHLLPPRARQDLRARRREDQPPCRLRDDRGGGRRRDRGHPVRRLDRRPDGRADGLCAQASPRVSAATR